MPAAQAQAARNRYAGGVGIGIQTWSDVGL